MEKLGVLFDPRFWIRNYRVSHAWSKQLEGFLNSVDPKDVKRSSFTLILPNGKKVWIGNWPYAYGNPYPKVADVLPTRRVTLKLKNFVKTLEEDNFKNYFKD